MTYKEIQDAIILDRFNETQRAAIKFAINSRYGRMWALEPWSFKRGFVYTAVGASGSFSLEDVGLQKVETIHRPLAGSSGRYAALESTRPELSAGDWVSQPGTPVGFTVSNGEVVMDKGFVPNTSVAVFGELAWQPLVDDTDVPLIPQEYHFALVSGGAADMLLRESDPSWQGEEKSFNDQMAEMRISYMSQQRTAHTAYPAWP